MPPGVRRHHHLHTHEVAPDRRHSSRAWQGGSVQAAPSVATGQLRITAATASLPTATIGPSSRGG